MQPYLAMGSRQWSQCLSPSFPFALKRWSPRPRHLLSLKPGKIWLSFRLTSNIAHETRPPREGRGAHPFPGLPLQIRPLLLLGPSGPYPGSLGAGSSRTPAMSSRNQQSPGDGLRFLSFSAPQPYSTYTYRSSGPPATSAPLLSIQSDSPWPLAQPERGRSRRRRHVPKETAGNQ